MESFIKLFRKSLESSVFQNANLWQVWCFCLMRANHKTVMVLFNGEEIILQPGQFISGWFEEPKNCRMNPSPYSGEKVGPKIIPRLEAIFSDADSEDKQISLFEKVS